MREPQGKGQGESPLVQPCLSALCLSGCRLCVNEVIQTQRLFYFLIVLARVLYFRVYSALALPPPSAGHVLGVLLNSVPYSICLCADLCVRMRGRLPWNHGSSLCLVGHLLRIRAGRVCVCVCVCIYISGACKGSVKKLMSVRISSPVDLWTMVVHIIVLVILM